MKKSIKSVLLIVVSHNRVNDNDVYKHTTCVLMQARYLPMCELVRVLNQQTVQG